MTYRLSTDVNRALLTPADRRHIRDMLRTFKACHEMGERDPMAVNLYICFRLEDLRKRGSITRSVEERCRRTIMAALEGWATLGHWWAERNPGKSSYEMPKTYRQLWLTQIIRDYKELLE